MHLSFYSKNSPKKLYIKKKKEEKEWDCKIDRRKEKVVRVKEEYVKILRNEELRKTRSFLVVRMAYTSDPNTKFYQQDFTGIINKADGSKTVLDHLFSTRFGKK